MSSTMTIRPTDPHRAATSIETKSELISDTKRGTRLGYVIWTASRGTHRPGGMLRRRAARHTRFPHCDIDKNQRRHSVMPFTTEAADTRDALAARQLRSPGVG